MYAALNFEFLLLLDYLLKLRWAVLALNVFQAKLNWWFQAAPQPSK